MKGKNVMSVLDHHNQDTYAIFGSAATKKQTPWSLETAASS